ncbi:MAG: DUF1819 family protein [Megasphaera sp.]|jgi:hypothetical protein|nr:DUF1819 family protein [Megasphaera sp.]
MERKKYSARAVKLSFWFMEFRKFLELLNEGKSFEEIRHINGTNNIFGAPTTGRANQIYTTISARIKSLPSSFYPLFLNSDVATQKLYVLVSIMAHDTLFFDFVYEVVREKMIIGINELSDSDINVFFKDKQMQDENVAKWTDMTLTRLGRCYKTMLFEAGIIGKEKNIRVIHPPILDIVFENWLQDNGFGLMIKALTGVR